MYTRAVLGGLVVCAVFCRAVVAADPPPKSGSQDESYRLPVEVALPPEAPVTQHLQRADSAADGWPSEVLNEKGGKILKKLGPIIEARGEGLDAMKEYVAPDFAWSMFPRDSLQTAAQRGSVRIRRAVGQPKRYAGPDGLAEVIGIHAAPFDGREFEFLIKIDRVELHGADRGDTHVIYLAMGTTSEGVLQQNAHWVVHWDLTQGLDHPVLGGIDVLDHEEISAPARLYSDCTRALLGRNDSFATLERGIDYYWGRVDMAMGLSLYGDYAMSLGDVTNDGLDDVYVCQPGGLPNLLFRRELDGTLTDISPRSGVELYNDTGSSLIVDLDNDGNQDMVLTTLTHVAIMRGRGNGTFENAGGIGLSSMVSISATDYDGDGLLDLYFCGYAGSRSGGTSEAVYDANNGKPNALWRNEGGFIFRDVTSETGLDENNRRFSFAAVWEDYDNDGDCDLYVANDFGRNNLYRNENGRFRDVAGEAGVEDKAAGMGVTWGDINRDGLMDLYVSNMFSSAGGRVAFQRQFAGTVGDQRIPAFAHFARGNTLFVNAGDGTFRDVSDEAGITMGRWSWGSEFADVDNDGWDDLVVPNGYITNYESQDL
jgi:hypothetical protein